jgi:hypothetical protein
MNMYGLEPRTEGKGAPKFCVWKNNKHCYHTGI